MENEFIRCTSKRIAYWLNRYTLKDGVELQKMILGMEILIINISKLIIIYVLAAIIGIVLQALLIQRSYALVRRYSFGLHALNSTVCTVVSCLLFVMLPWGLLYVGIGNIAVLAIFIPVILCLYLYAPADTKARPLVGRKLRAKLKIKAIVCGVFIMIITLLVPNESVKLLLTLGAVYQAISILPLTYKILKRSVRNYEIYEQKHA